MPVTNSSNKELYIVKDIEEDTKKIKELYKRFMYEQYKTIWNDELEEQFKQSITIYDSKKAIAQALVIPVPKCNVQEVLSNDILEDNSERGNGSLGSSKK